MQCMTFISVLQAFEEVMFDHLYGDALTPWTGWRFSLADSEQMVIKCDVS